MEVLVQTLIINAAIVCLRFENEREFSVDIDLSIVDNGAIGRAALDHIGDG